MSAGATKRIALPRWSEASPHGARLRLKLRRFKQFSWGDGEPTSLEIKCDAFIRPNGGVWIADKGATLYLRFGREYPDPGYDDHHGCVGGFDSSHPEDSPFFDEAAPPEKYYFDRYGLDVYAESAFAGEDMAAVHARFLATKRKFVEAVIADARRDGTPPIGVMLGGQVYALNFVES